MNDNLTTEQILCLQLLGYKASAIIKADACFFNRVMSDNEAAEEALRKAELLFDRQRRIGVRTLPFYHQDFPEELRKIGDECPPLIHLKGNMELLGKKAVAVIGARQADRRGCGAAYKLGAGYGGKGWVVISGLAMGCDAAAHRGCLDAKGGTIAVVATGLDLTHPKENKPLQDMILSAGGLLMSEQAAGVKANPARLVARNRLQAAMSEKVIVAQCPEHSGTMHTVRFALRYGKSICAVRFDRRDALSSGNSYLLDTGLALPV